MAAKEPYVPDPFAGASNLDEALSYIGRELDKIRNAFAGGGVGTVDYPELHAEPQKGDGVTIAFADGTDWNPGSGRGLYAWFNNQWNPLFATSELPDPPIDEDPPDPPEPPSAEEPIFLNSFETSPNENGFYTYQTKDPSRITLVPIARIGTKGVRLHTSGSDTGVVQSGANERCEIRTTEQQVDGFIGREHWHAFSVLLPDDLQMTQADSFTYLLMQFHVKSASTPFRQPPFALYIMNRDPPGTHLVWQIRGGNDDRKRRFVIDGGAVPVRNVWHDFVMHIKWGATHGNTGAISQIWMRKGNAAMYDKIVDNTDANTYPGAIMYQKLSNYHSNVGVPSSVIFDRHAMGNTPYSVAMAPLEGVA